MHSLACLSPPSQPHPRDVAAGHVSAVEAEAQRGQQPALRQGHESSQRQQQTRPDPGRARPWRALVFHEAVVWVVLAGDGDQFLAEGAG